MKMKSVFAASLSLATVVACAQEATQSDPINIRGDVIFIGIAGHSTNGLWGLTKTGRVAGRRNFVSVGMDRTLQFYHNINITLDGTGNEGLNWKVSTNASNGYSYDTLLDSWNRPMFGMPYGEPEENNLWFDEANFTFEPDIGKSGLEVTVGRFYHSSGAFFLARPRYAEFYENPRVNNGQHVLDGFRTKFDFNGVGLNVLLARVDDLKYSDGDDFTSLTGETLFGVELDFLVGKSGSLKAVHYWEKDDDTGMFVGSTEDQMRTFGLEGSLGFSDFYVSGSFAQTDYYIGDSSVLNDNNTATSVSVNFNGGSNWGASGLYSKVEGNFGAQGSWGRLGPYFNPANVDQVGVEAWLSASDTIGARASYKKFEPADSAAMGAFGIMSGDDEIDVFELALDIDLNDRSHMTIGYETLDGSLLGGDTVGLDWYSLDFKYLINDDASIDIHYLFSNGDMPVTYSGISNSVWRGGALAVQGTLRF